MWRLDAFPSPEPFPRSEGECAYTRSHDRRAARRARRKAACERVELGVGGMVTRKLNVFGGYTLMNSKIIESNTPGEEGKQMINTPKHSVNLWSTWTPLPRLQIGGGVRFVGSRYGNTTNTRYIGSYTTGDAMVSYRVHRYVDLRVNLYNLNDAYYFDRLGGGHLIPGPARSAVVGTTVHF